LVLDLFKLIMLSSKRKDWILDIIIMLHLAITTVPFRIYALQHDL